MVTEKQKEIFKIFDDMIDNDIDVWDEIQKGDGLKRKISRYFPSVEGLSKTKSALRLYGFDFEQSVLSERPSSNTSDWIDFEDELDLVCKDAFDNFNTVFDHHIGRKSDISDYLKGRYGGLRGYFSNNGLTNLEDFIFILCRKCGDYKSLSNWHSDSSRPFGMCSDCGDCGYGRVKKQYEMKRDCPVFKDRRSEYQKKYYVNNREKSRLIYQKRLARKKSLPDFLSDREVKKSFEYFNGLCALSGDSVNINIEHTIPLASGHGGTIVENIVPMRSDLNGSKNDRNIFEWFEENRERFNLCQRRFDEMITYLSHINGVTEKEYREFVYWCHDNPRTIEHTEIDNERSGYKKPSIDIWKESKEVVV